MDLALSAALNVAKCPEVGVDVNHLHSTLKLEAVSAVAPNVAPCAEVSFGSGG